MRIMQVTNDVQFRLIVIARIGLRFRNAEKDFRNRESF